MNKNKIKIIKDKKFQKYFKKIKNEMKAKNKILILKTIRKSKIKIFKIKLNYKINKKWFKI